MRYQDFYQYTLLLFAAVVLFAVGAFIYKEVFPEYKEVQNVYKKVEKVRSALTGAPPAPFETGIKQILIPDPQNGPELIDRCTSCHVALDLPHFSPTRIAVDVNGNRRFDVDGKPLLERNPDYVWDLIPPTSPLRRYEGALQMHPLIGVETTPFELHPVAEYGCTACHSGNGRALVAKRAHGPVKDGSYEEGDSGPKPQFLERDPHNDPLFAQLYNAKPAHDLVFQTTPLLLGPLMVAKCMQCHQTFCEQWHSATEKVALFEKRKGRALALLEKSASDERAALIALLALHRRLTNDGEEKTHRWLEEQMRSPVLTEVQIDAYAGQLAFLDAGKEILPHVSALVGSQERAEALLAQAAHTQEPIEALTAAWKSPKEEKSARERKVVERFEALQEPLMVAGQDRELVRGLKTHLDTLLIHYERGKELYLSQACYACHRIAGYSRAAIGPELTQIGLSYPWYVKESIVWPQADLPSSTMPNFHLDHEEVADLMAFLMAQTGERKTVSEVDHEVALAQWEAGEKLPWEKAIPPYDIHNLAFGQEVFITQGCAACHKLEGFETGVEVGDRAWFYATFPEHLLGSTLAQRVQEQGEVIDTHLSMGKKSALLEKIEREDPELLPAFYPNFKFAKRAQNHRLSGEELERYKERLHRVQMAYIHEYGLGREIAPPLNWSGVYRDEAWLLGHFHNPAAYTARSLMPAMPFDDTKFYALNYMLRVMGKSNRERLQERWKEGFNPQQAYTLLCASCHGDQRQGNGPVAQWIYPVPKNLRNPVFLRNLTKERAVESITHGVVGTPMPPWGKGVLTEEQVTQLVDWLYQGLPSTPRTHIKEEEQKWGYSTRTVVEEMVQENALLQPAPNPPVKESDYFEQEKGGTYIREKYYTQYNLDEIRPYYNVNCAVCHGKEGTGAGERATALVEAKPRMFTNLPWIQTRDDLYLLRAIKYGVPGTAMTAWGDQTTSKQRMQLTLLIRSFTRAALAREQLTALLYARFDEKQIALEEKRIPNATALNKLRTQRDALELAQGESAEEAATLCQERFMLKEEIDKLEALDRRFIDEIARNKEKRTRIESLGVQLIGKEPPQDVLSGFYSYITTEDPHALDRVFAFLDEKIAFYQEKIDQLGIDTRAPLADKQVQELIGEQRGYINLKTAFLKEKSKY